MLLQSRISSYDEEKNTFECVWSTGATRAMHSIFGPITETLSMDPGHIRLGRLKAGAPFLAVHRSDNLKDVLGVVEDAWLAEGKGHARIKLSDREDIAHIRADIKNGILRNISVGYDIHKFVEYPSNNETRNFTAEDWEPLEISCVPVPADAGAQTRNYDATKVIQITKPKTIEKKDDTMTIERYKRFMFLGENAGMSVKEIKQAIEDEKVTVEDFEKRAWDFVAKRDVVTPSPVPTPGSGIIISDSPQFRSVIQTAIELKIDPQAEVDAKLKEDAREFRGMSMIELAKTVIEKTGVSTRGMLKKEVASRAIGSTDFPIIMENVANKKLRAAYKQAPITYSPIVSIVTKPDFKPTGSIQIGEAPALEEMAEGAEITYGIITEGKDQYALRSWGKGLKFTRQALINDDLNIFQKIPSMFVTSIVNLESDLVWDILLKNNKMGDGVNLFDTRVHKNLLPAGPLNLDNIEKARLLMINQRGKDGKIYLNLRPKYLIIPPSLEFNARRLLSAPAYAETKDFNPIQGMFQIIIEPRLETGGPNPLWFLAADKAQIDLIELAYLEGESGPRFKNEEEFNTSAMKMKVELDVASGIFEYRGFVRVG